MTEKEDGPKKRAIRPKRPNYPFCESQHDAGSWYNWRRGLSPKSR